MLTPSRLLLYSIGSSSSSGTNSCTFAVVAVIHAAIILTPTLQVTLCPPPDQRWDSMLIPFLVNVIGVVVMPLCLVLQFTARLRMLYPRTATKTVSACSHGGYRSRSSLLWLSDGFVGQGCRLGFRPSSMGRISDYGCGTSCVNIMCTA
jgi:hypothetical protein